MDSVDKEGKDKMREVDPDSFRVRSARAQKQRNVQRNRRIILFNAALALLVIMFVLINKIVSLQTAKPVKDPGKAAMEQKGSTIAPKETGAPEPTVEPTKEPVPERTGQDRWIRPDLDAKKPMVALTFDDGPYTPVTSRVLKTLKKYDSRATFFVVANRVPTFPKVFNQAYQEGNQIASHTYGHVNLSKLKKKQIKKELDKANREVKKQIGCKVSALRPPGGSISQTMRDTIDVPMVCWSVDTEDWKSRNKKKILKRCKGIEDGDIVLMHDLYPTTADAVEVLVPRLIKKGYQLVTVDELFYYKGIKAKAGSVYRSGK